MNTHCEILSPKNLAACLEFLNSNIDGIKIFAGGTDVVTGIKQGSKRFIDSKMLIDINHINEIKGIKIKENMISIGAATTFSEICDSILIEEKLPLLKKACSTIGSLQIRNRATIAGNFVNNAPCADTVPALLVYNAKVEIASSDSKREISLQEFLLAPYKTQLKKNELVTRICITVPQKHLIWDFYKLGRRRAVAISRITLAFLMELEKGVIQDVKIASGAITPIGTRFGQLEKFAIGKTVDDALFRTLATKMGEEILAVTGLRWSSEYKLPVVQQMFYSILRSAAARNL